MDVMALSMTEVDAVIKACDVLKAIDICYKTTHIYGRADM